jgi:type III secretion system (T3SS) inner membrane Yop/YscD-like protein
MRFEISYTGGTTHEVELPGQLCVVGRDPGCDIVLNDAKCSRRHAVIEETADGVKVRDSGSANGIYVNGKKVESSLLRPGDTLRMGEVRLRLLPELGETVIVGPEGIHFDPGISVSGPTQLDTGDQPVLEAPPAPPPAPPPADPAPAPSAKPRAGSQPRPAPRPRPSPEREPREGRHSRPPSRPATVTLLAGLWALFVPLAVAGVLVGAARLSAGVLGWVGAGVLAVALAGLGTAMALGLRALAPWARHLQIATAALGLLACPFTLAAATVLLYMTRPEVKAAFEGGTAERRGQDSAEPTFALSLVGMLVLGLALLAIAVLVL